MLSWPYPYGTVLSCPVLDVLWCVYLGWSLQGEDGKPLYSKFDEDGLPTHDAAGEEFGKASNSFPWFVVTCFYYRLEVFHTCTGP